MHSAWHTPPQPISQTLLPIFPRAWFRDCGGCGRGIGYHVSAFLCILLESHQSRQIFAMVTRSLGVVVMWSQAE